MKKVIRKIVLMGMALSMSVTSAVSPAGVVFAAQEQYESGADIFDSTEEDSFAEEIFEEDNSEEDNFEEDNSEEADIEVISDDSESEDSEPEAPEAELFEDEILDFEDMELEDSESEEIQLTEDSVSGNSFEESAGDADNAEFTEETSGKCGDNATWSFDESTGALKISGKGEMYDYSEEEPAPWFEIGARSLYVSDGITRIGNYAFFKATDRNKRADSIYLPNTLKSIGDYAFQATYFSDKVEKFVVPDSVTELGKRAFSYCQLYNATTMEEKQVGGTFVLGKGVKVIPEECFWGAVAVEVVLPEGLERIEDKGMYYFQGCKKFVFPSTLKYIGEMGLSYDWSYTVVNSNITFKGDMPKFGKDCFKYRCGIIYYPAGNTTYNEKSIAATQALTNYGLTWREEGYVPSGKAGKNITWKTYNVTEGKRTLKILEFTGTGLMKDYSLSDLPDWYPERISVDRIIFDSRITGIGDYAFFGMGNVNNVNYKTNPLVLPANLEKIGDYAFYHADVPIVTMPETCSYIGDKAFAYWNTTEATSNAFPKGVKHIGDYAFQSCKMAFDVKWDKIESIGAHAFIDVKNMTFSTAFPDSLKIIGDSAFSRVPNMKGQLSLPGVTNIGDYAFNNCKDITGKVELPAIESIGSGIFYGTSVTEVEFGENFSKIVNDNSYYASLGGAVKTVTFRCPFFSDIYDLFRYWARDQFEVTINYPAGNGWPYEVSEYYKSIHFVPYGKHNVTFVYPDESEHKTQVPVGEKIIAPTVTGLGEGVEIIGWFTYPEPEKEYEWNFNKIPMNDVKLYALTNQIELDVAYFVPYDLKKMYKDGASGGVYHVKYGECARYRRVAKEGGRFKGWFEDKECTKPYDFSTPVKYNTKLYSNWELAEVFDFSTATDNIKYDKDISFVYDNRYYYPDPEISINYGDGFELLERGVDYKIQYPEGTKYYGFVDVGDYTITVKGLGNCTGELTINIHISQLDISTAKDIRPLKDYTCEYDGYEHKHLQDIYLERENGYSYLDNDDYDTEFINNGAKRPFVDAGTYTVRLTGKNNCKGTLEFKQIIEPKSIDSYINFRHTKEVTYEYNKKVQKFKPDPALWDGEKYIPIKEGVDYTVEYENEDAKGAFKEPGVYHIKVKGMGNFKDEYTIVEKITDSKSIAKATVTGIKDRAFTGMSEKITGLKVKYKGKTLTEGEHYRILYNNITYAGTGRLYIIGIEDGGFYGYKEVTFKITPHKISKKDVEITGLSDGKVYTGGEITADSLKIGSGLETYRAVLVGIEKASYKEKYPTGGGDYDYTYEYKKNVNAGTATLVIRGVNNCKGTIKKTFKIRKAELNEEAVAQGRIRIELPESVTYIKGKNKPQPVVYYKPEGSSKEILLVKGKDYTLAYSNNTKVNDGSGKKVPKVKIKGIKNFKGTITRTFTIRL